MWTSKNYRRRIQTDCSGPTLTKQAFKDECDINKIMSKYQKNGQLPDMIKTNPKFGDFSNPNSYQDSLNLVIHAQEQFASLSAAVRKRFNNDPAQFLEFTADPNNLPEMVKLGLATKRQTNLNNDDQAQNPNLSTEKSKDPASSSEGSKK